MTRVKFEPAFVNVRAREVLPLTGGRTGVPGGAGPITPAAAQGLQAAGAGGVLGAAVTLLLHLLSHPGDVGPVPAASELVLAGVHREQEAGGGTVAPHTPTRHTEALSAGAPVRAETGTGGQVSGHLVRGVETSPDTGHLGLEPVTGGVSQAVVTVDVVVTVLAAGGLRHEVAGTLTRCPGLTELGLGTPAAQGVLDTLLAVHQAGAAPIPVRLQVVGVEDQASLFLLQCHSGLLVSPELLRLEEGKLIFEVEGIVRVEVN